MSEPPIPEEGLARFGRALREAGQPTDDLESKARIWFSLRPIVSGYRRTPDAERRAEGPQYKKGWELRFVAITPEDAERVSGLLRQLGVEPGKPFAKHERTVVPVYGKRHQWLGALLDLPIPVVESPVPSPVAKVRRAKEPAPSRKLAPSRKASPSRAASKGAASKGAASKGAASKSAAQSVPVPQPLSRPPLPERPKPVERPPSPIVPSEAVPVSWRAEPRLVAQVLLVDTSYQPSVWCGQPVLAGRCLSCLDLLLVSGDGAAISGSRILWLRPAGPQMPRAPIESDTLSLVCLRCAERVIQLFERKDRSLKQVIGQLLARMRDRMPAER